VAGRPTNPARRSKRLLDATSIAHAKREQLSGRGDI
jgi:hypothetical protein